MSNSGNNPAQRLLTILEAVKERSDTSFSQVWAKYFGHPESDRVSLFRNLLEMINLVDSLERRIRLCPSVNLDLYLEQLPTLRSLICPNNLNVRWSDVSSPLHSGLLTYLRFCSDLLSSSLQEKEIDVEALNQIKVELMEALSSVLQSEMDPDLKFVLYELIMSAVKAIENYRIAGNEGLKKAIALAVGQLSIHKTRLNESPDVDVLKKAMSSIQKLIEIVALATGLKKLYGSFELLLGDGQASS